MAPLHRCGNGHWMGSLDSERLSRERTLNCKKKTLASPNSRERPLIRKTGKRARGRKREGGCSVRFMKMEDKSLLDVENVETTGERCCHLS